MPIEIIPRKKVMVPAWQIIFFIISLIFLIITISLYFVLGSNQEKYKNKIEETKNSIEIEKREEEKKLEEISSREKEIGIFSKIVGEHIFVSDVFKILEKGTHPKVMYTGFDLNIEKNSLSLPGQTESFLTLGQQFSLFKENPMIKEINISKISKTKEGKIEFNFDLSLNPEIFKWKE